ncbi:MAG: LysR substrate-binding domain-containing protein [Pseudonocardia sp.]|nr:LysR substrate-binding domain-containing protein [Pseudonocardia sp.]
MQAVEVLASHGMDADIGLRISHFAALPRLLESSELVAIIPSTVADWCVRAADVRSFTLPCDVPRVEIALYTHDRRVPSGAVDWLREVIVGVLATPSAG